MRNRTQMPLLLLFLLATAVALPMIPSASAESTSTDWAAQLRAMDEALARGDVPGAHASWREAYVAAHVGRGWPGMLAVGDAALRLGRATGETALYEGRARRVYLTALLRARRDASLDGVLAAGEAFGPARRPRGRPAGPRGGHRPGRALRRRPGATTGAGLP